MAKSRTIIIAGAGISGLSTALCLVEKGYRVDLHEKAARLETAGAGIQLSPNAVRILERLGVLRDIQTTATAPEIIRIRSASNAKNIKSIPLGTHAIQRYGTSYLTIHRSDLQQALLNACRHRPDILLNLNSTICDAVEHANGISAIAAGEKSSETLHGAAILFADGIHSTGRKNVFEYPGARHSGFEAWRGLISSDKLPASFDLDNTQLIWGRGAHAVLYPIRKGRYLNAVICIDGADKDNLQPHQARTSDLNQRLKGWHESWLGLFSLASNWSVWPLLAMPKTRNWFDGNMALIGDAAHGMLPFSAQGAAMGIEDGDVLARQFERHGATPVAFETWQKARQKRVHDVARLAERNGGIYHMGLPGSLARNIVLRFSSADKLLERQSWIYDWTGQ